MESRSYIDAVMVPIAWKLPKTEKTTTAPTPLPAANQPAANVGKVTVESIAFGVFKRW